MKYADLISKYAAAVNAASWDDCAELFQHGASVELDLGDRGRRELRGGRELAEFVKVAVARFATFEMVILEVVELDDECGLMYLMEVRTDSAGHQTRAIGRYRDRYSVNADGSLTFVQRRYRSLTVID